MSDSENNLKSIEKHHKKMGDYPFNSAKIVTVLRDNGFRAHSSWDSLARELHVPLDKRRQLKQKDQADNLQTLEEVIDHWLRNDPNNSWAVLINAVERTEEKAVANALRKNLQIVRGDSPPSCSSTSGAAAESEETPSIQLRASKSLLKVQESLQPLLVLSINDFVPKLFSHDLISMELYDKQYNYTPASESERANFLVFVIYKRAAALESDGKSAEAKGLIRKFGEVIYESDYVLRHIGQEIMELPDSQSLMANQDKIKCIIQSSLTTIAVKLMSLDLLTDDEYDSVTDPDADHAKRFLAEIFRSLRESVKQDYNNYSTLLEILEDMGPPISVAATRIADQEFYP